MSAHELAKVFCSANKMRSRVDAVTKLLDDISSSLSAEHMTPLHDVYTKLADELKERDDRISRKDWSEVVQDAFAGCIRTWIEKLPPSTFSVADCAWSRTLEIDDTSCDGETTYIWLANGSYHMYFSNRDRQFSGSMLEIIDRLHEYIDEITEVRVPFVTYDYGRSLDVKTYLLKRDGREFSGTVITPSSAPPE